MNKQLYLHIGTHKTGTTALQHYLSHNRDVLETTGWLYPRSGCPGGANYGHHDVASSFLGHGEFDIDVLREEIDRSKCSRIILSSEEFEFCRDPKPIAQAFNDLDVWVIVYFRRQDDFVLSEFNQNVKMGSYTKSLTLFANKLEGQGRLDYFAICSRWAGVFGHERVLANIYRPKESVISHFFRLLGLKCDACIDPPRIHSNLSVDARLIGVLRIIGQLREEGVNEAFSKEILKYVREFGKSLDQQHKFSLMNITDRRQFFQRFQASNAEFSKHFAGGEEFADPGVENAEEIKVGENNVPLLLFKNLLLRLAKGKVI
ncbi:hypothetical protein [Nitrosomonas sp. Nm33]|uniref:hypothetical protein n=1 Tax=Nitrosomonas sp. Nm33 TaxID=133724 RepID=UPI0008970003|nr:hypothetical protein [Nitrosomonas sp. Nm33]SDY40074.1 hypothetical protein SAMN05421755_102033 [Nitrosomonas sp. Nm33]